MQQFISLLATPESDCHYLPGKRAITHVVSPRTELNPILYGQLLEQGFRRSGNLVYTPACLACQQCQSLKLAPEVFHPNRSQRRCLKRNADLQIVVRSARDKDEYFALYQRYLESRHADGEMANPTRESFGEFLFSDWCTTLFVEMRREKVLLGVAVVDVVPRGLSAVYSFFEPEESSRGLGTFAVLWQLETARKRRMPWVYLGYWIRDNKKMSYKTSFAPALVLRDHRWQALLPDAISAA